MKLSVVVTIVDGEAALTRCLEVLERQASTSDLEVVVPFDHSVKNVPSLVASFPRVRFVDVEPVRGCRPADTRSGLRDRCDYRRAAGLLHARGDVVALIEDRGLPRDDWTATLTRAHDSGAGVIGGAVENGVDQLFNWAVYFCDFSRYQPPFKSRNVSYVSDVNVSYKRRALDLVRDQLDGRFVETSFHWALLRRGETLYLTPDAVVTQMRSSLTLGRLMLERFSEGRLFAFSRCLSCSPRKRMVYLAGSPLLPAILFLRHASTQLSKRKHFGEFVRAAPIVILLLLCWTAGEAYGYVTRRA